MMPTLVAMLHLISIILIKQMQWCHRYHMILMLVPVGSHDQQVKLLLPLIILFLTNGMVPLMTLMASYDTDNNSSGITWPRMLCCTLSESS